MAESCSLRGSSWALAARCARGSGLSTFDYGVALEEHGARVDLVFCLFFPDPSYNSTVARFEQRWPGRVVRVPKSPRKVLSFDFNAHLQNHAQISTLYYQTGGEANCGDEPVQLLPRCAQKRMRHWRLGMARLGRLVVRLAVHGYFASSQPWGDAFARVSPMISPSAADVPVVPYIVRPLPRSEDNQGLRARLGIPRDATVLCSYGGRVVFDIPHVRQTVCDLGTGNGHPHLYFLFANHRPFCRSQDAARRVLHLPNLGRKQAMSNFIASCDAMLHGRGAGETFGLAGYEVS